MGKITREWRMMGDDQEADSTMRGEGRQCETIDGITYDVAYIAKTETLLAMICSLGQLPFDDIVYLMLVTLQHFWPHKMNRKLT